LEDSNTEYIVSKQLEHCMVILKNWPVFTYGCRYEFTTQTSVFKGS